MKRRPYQRLRRALLSPAFRVGVIPSIDDSRTRDRITIDVAEILGRPAILPRFSQECEEVINAFILGPGAPSALCRDLPITWLDSLLFSELFDRLRGMEEPYEPLLVGDRQAPRQFEDFIKCWCDHCFASPFKSFCARSCAGRHFLLRCSSRRFLLRFHSCLEFCSTAPG